MSQQMGLPQSNPANAPEKQLPERSRIPMSLPVQRLAVPEIPGLHCHWMKGDAQRIQQALRAGYRFIEQDEVDLNTFGVADGADDSGHKDLGSRVSIVAGTDETGGAQRLYLMGLPQELWDSDQAVMAERQEAIAAQLRGDKGFAEAGLDASNRYVSPQSDGNRNIFLPNKRRP